MSLAKHASIVSIFTLGSRVLGYIRDMFIAHFLGATALADAFFVAFRLPNFFRQISAEGAFNSAFVPLFSGKLSQSGPETASRFAAHTMILMTLILTAFTLVMVWQMPLIMTLLAPGFKENSEQFTTLIYFGRIVFPYLIFISLVSLLSGIMQSHRYFAAAAAAPILLNLCLIGALVFASHWFETNAHALVWGVFAAGFCQLGWMVLACQRKGILPRFSYPQRSKDLTLLLRRMIPGIIGGSVTQLNIWINTVIATTISSAVSYLYYADRLVQFPLALIGTAMATALLPNLSKHFKENDTEKAITVQNKALEMTMFLTLPAAVALIVLSYPIMVVMFERGAFTNLHSHAAASALIAYACGLPAFVMIKIFLPGFFGAGDTKTPVYVAAVCLLVNVAISLSLIGHIGHVGLAIATSISSWLNAAILIFLLRKRNAFTLAPEKKQALLAMLLTALIMGGIIEMYQTLLPITQGESFITILARFSGAVILGLTVYFTLSHYCGVMSLKAIKAQLKR